MSGELTEDGATSSPPPGWLHDRRTGQTRWWDGRQWTDHVQPNVPRGVGYGYRPTFSSGSATAQTTLSAKNGPAKASLILILVVLLGVTGLLWLLSGLDPAVATVLGVLNFLMVISAVVLSIIGLVIAIRRPTKKRESIFGLIVSSLLLAFLVLRVATVPSTLDGAVLESQIGSWAAQESGLSATADCPEAPADIVGSTFACTSQLSDGTTWTVVVTVAETTVSWEVVE